MEIERPDSTERYFPASIILATLIVGPQTDPRISRSELPGESMPVKSALESPTTAFYGSVHRPDVLAAQYDRGERGS